MLKIEIITAGRLKNSPSFELCQEYIKRIQWPLAVYEVESKSKDAGAAQREEIQKIKQHVKTDAFVIVLDKKGKNLGSTDFARTMEKIQNSGKTYLQFVIGGAEGLTDEVIKRANLVLSFGQPTWPHILARIMLLEQIYRAQQILIGHPYHRE